MKYKTISIQVPAKYKWMATDADGEICLFERKPVLNEYSGYWYSSNGNIKSLGLTETPKDFRTTLKKI